MNRHLEAPSTHDLEPVDHTLHRRERVQMSICGKFLIGRDLPPIPAEKKDKSGVDDFNKYGRVYGDMWLRKHEKCGYCIRT